MILNNVCKASIFININRNFLKLYFDISNQFLDLRLKALSRKIAQNIVTSMLRLQRQFCNAVNM